MKLKACCYAQGSLWRSLAQEVCAPEFLDIFVKSAGKLPHTEQQFLGCCQKCNIKNWEPKMAKKDIQDDVLGNKLSLLNAKNSNLLSSWMGAPAPEALSANVSDSKDEDADLKQADFGHDR
jgi:hypothetical protein